MLVAPQRTWSHATDGTGPVSGTLPARPSNRVSAACSAGEEKSSDRKRSGPILWKPAV